MDFAYLISGEVTGLNRVANPGADELTGACLPSDLIYGMVPEYYTAPGGSLTPKSQGAVEDMKNRSLWSADKKEKLENGFQYVYDLTGIIKQDNVHQQLGLDTLPSSIRDSVESYCLTVQDYVKAVINIEYPTIVPDIASPPGGVAGGVPMVINKFHEHVYIN